VAQQAAAPADNPWSVFLAVTCNDVEWPSDVRTYQRAVAEDRERYPLYGAASANIMPCAFWPYEPAEPPVAIDDEGPANVLVLQNRRDPVTPHRGGELLDEKFGDRSRLVSVDGSGHGVYVIGDNECALKRTEHHDELPGGREAAEARPVLRVIDGAGGAFRTANAVDHAAVPALGRRRVIGGTWVFRTRRPRRSCFLSHPRSLRSSLRSSRYRSSRRIR
jgi:TAP-like protein